MKEQMDNGGEEDARSLSLTDLKSLQLLKADWSGDYLTCGGQTEIC